MGVAFTGAWTARVDEWVNGLFAAAVDGRSDGLALVAVGGYGRGELAPFSDLDLLLLHHGIAGIDGVAQRVWYPIWDEGLKLGHAVRTVREALALAGENLDTATSLLSIRHLAGDDTLSAELAERARLAWRKRAKRWLGVLADSVAARHARFGEVAFLLEPELKEGRGGLRDVHALNWAEQARAVLERGDDALLAEAYRTLLEVRVELQREAGRPTDLLTLQDQDAVAAAIGGDADELMSRVSAAARTVAWVGDEAWHRVTVSLTGSLSLLGWRSRDRAPGMVLREGEVHLEPSADPATDPLLVLRAAALAGEKRARLARATLDRLALRSASIPEPWPDEAREFLVELLRCGHHAIPVIEALDQTGLWCRLIPEWEPVRSLPQRNAYHRFTVDRHLFEAAANAAALTDRVRRPDLLVIGALLHDLGKGYPGDHSVVGIDLMRTVGGRMGFPEADVDLLAGLVRHHLLLPDAATRRDLNDDATIEAVAAAVGSTLTLELLAALTEADSLATGPAAWSSWKSELVHALVNKTAHVLGGGKVHDLPERRFPAPEQLDLLRAGRPVTSGDGDTLVLVAADRPGLFSRAAGVLALHGLDVLAADAFVEGGMALEQFRVSSHFGSVISWDRVVVDVERAVAGRLAVEARLAERARTYARRRSPVTTPPTVSFDNDASATATVIEVHAADSVGVLHRITRALAELDLDIPTAKVQTLGEMVVDAFYVRDTSGSKLTDTDLQGEVRLALLHAVTRS